ncbi:four helix bundle sensory module for signal transduction domain-containing protein [Ditylenchus destructor]|nr:four helix bundle sensory module for signal transduction domain-containing protein [Ditylenchus destructor]
MLSAMTSNRSIGQRLGLVQALVLVIALIGSALGYWGLSRVAAQTQAMYEDSIVTERVASDWYRNVFNGATRTTAIAASADPNLATFFTDQIAESTKTSSGLQERLDKLLTTPDERANFEKVSALRKEYLRVRDAITAAKEVRRRRPRQTDLRRRVQDRVDPLPGRDPRGAAAAARSARRVDEGARRHQPERADRAGGLRRGGAGRRRRDGGVADALDHGAAASGGRGRRRHRALRPDASHRHRRHG